MTCVILPKNNNTVKEECNGWFSKLRLSINLKFVPTFKNEDHFK